MFLYHVVGYLILHEARWKCWKCWKFATLAQQWVWNVHLLTVKKCTSSITTWWIGHWAIYSLWSMRRAIACRFVCVWECNNSLILLSLDFIPVHWITCELWYCPPPCRSYPVATCTSLQTCLASSRSSDALIMWSLDVLLHGKYCSWRATKT